MKNLSLSEYGAQDVNNHAHGLVQFYHQWS